MLFENLSWQAVPVGRSHRPNRGAGDVQARRSFGQTCVENELATVRPANEQSR